MSEYNNNVYANDGLTFNQYLTKVFTTVALGLGISALASILTSMIFPTLTGVAFGVMLAACVAEFVVCLVFSLRLTKMSKQGAWICYILYAVLTGISFTSIITYYELGSVMLAFGATCLMFVVMAVIGHTTSVDLSKFQGIILPALMSLIVVSILNVIFFKSDLIQWIINYAGIVVFLFLIAYDMQKLRNFYQMGLSEPGISENIMIYGAFQLFLDFINLFIRILEIFGKKKDD